MEDFCHKAFVKQTRIMCECTALFIQSCLLTQITVFCVIGALNRTLEAVRKTFCIKFKLIALFVIKIIIKTTMHETSMSPFYKQLYKTTPTKRMQ